MAFNKQDLCDRFINGHTRGKSHNAYIDGDKFFLYRTCIAERIIVAMHHRERENLSFIDALKLTTNGWDTVTTKSYLNLIAPSADIRCRRGKLSVNGVPLVENDDTYIKVNRFGFVPTHQQGLLTQSLRNHWSYWPTYCSSEYVMPKRPKYVTMEVRSSGTVYQTVGKDFMFTVKAEALPAGHPLEGTFYLAKDVYCYFNYSFNYSTKDRLRYKDVYWPEKTITATSKDTPWVIVDAVTGATACVTHSKTRQGALEAFDHWVSVYLRTPEEMGEFIMKLHAKYGPLSRFKPDHQIDLTEGEVTLDL